jgi:glutamine synthetase
MYYVGGLLRHAAALTAFSNPTTNSYKRLVPGFEAPVNLVFSAANRSAAIRIPMYDPNDPRLKRIEFRVPDPSCNPYLAFASQLLAGLDGIINKIHPGNPIDINIYELSAEEKEDLAVTPASLGDALSALEADHDFLVQGGVFTQDFLDAYIAYKRAELSRLETAPHPLEFEMYYHI